MIYLDNTTRPWKEAYNLPEVMAVREKIKDSFKDLIFDEGPHKYYWHGKTIPSVSRTIDQFVEPFPTEKKAQECYEKYYNDPTSKYYQMTASDIKKQWKQKNDNANNQGTLAHAFGENAMHYMVGDYDAISDDFKDRLVNGKFEARTGFEKAIVKFWNDMPDEYVPMLVENRVYAMCGKEIPVYAGTFDLLVYCTIPGKEGLIIMDYKTNEDLYKNFNGKTLLPPLTEFLDSPFEHYRIQQFLYCRALREINIHIKAKRLIWIKQNGEYVNTKLGGYNDKTEEKIIKKIIESCI